MSISKLAAGVSESMTLAITAKAKKLKSEGISIIGFTAGEPDFDTPDLVKQSAKAALDAGFTKYTPASGMPELKAAICEKLSRENGLDYAPNQIVVSTGAKSSLYHALLALVDEGDEVIVPSPCWLTYKEQIRLVGGKCVFVDVSDSGCKLSGKRFEENITPKTKCIILNSPSNPTGSVYGAEELREIAKVAVEHGIYVISDEIYEKLVYGKEHISIASLGEEIKKLTVVVNGMSKAYSMTGWRVGYTASSPEIAKAIGNVQSHTTSNACSISQYASVAALGECDRFIKKSQAAFQKRRDLITAEADKLPEVSYVNPEGAFYLFMNVSAYYGKSFNGTPIGGSVDFANCLLDAGVAVVPGLPFEDDRFIRLSYAISEEDIVEGMRRIGAFLRSLS